MLNASLVSVLVHGSQRGVHAALVLLLPYACGTLVFPYPLRKTAEHRVGSKLQDRFDGDILSLGQYHTVRAGEETRSTRAVEPCGAPHYQSHMPHLSKSKCEYRVQLEGTRVPRTPTRRD